MVEFSPLAGDGIGLRTPLYQFSLRATQWHEKLLPYTHSATDLLGCLPTLSRDKINPPPLIVSVRQVGHGGTEVTDSGGKGLAQFSQ